MDLDLDRLKQILELIRLHDLSEFEVEHDEFRLKVKRGGAPVVLPVVTGTAAVPASQSALAAPTPAAASPIAAAGPAAAPDDVELAVVKSPIVGTFYRSPEPEAPSFVEVGTMVKKGQVLCIIEAMKLMNEIDSEYDGEIVNVYVENGQPVQYGERLFAVRTA